ncbi:MAG: 50S ribosomal protein L5 [Phycisphaeraceae bacterium]|nr:50S ribosomal protein L5 [Phycisphaeraceae bacterium]MCB9847289.1 50S ribosomal protein L5 [Phycisphaeraceae bacterium]
MSDTKAPTRSAPPRLKTRYDSEIRPALGKKFGCTNSMSQPRIDKVVLNVNMGRHLDGTKIPANVKDTVIDTLTTISGQKPVVIKAKRSVSNFKVREGYETACRVTLRRERMWDFLDRLINLYTPRIKDFRGLKDSSFDPDGNYSMGLNEQAVFPEIDMGKANFIHGMNINVVFRNSDAEKSRFALAELGMPFRKPEER